MGSWLALSFHILDFLIIRLLNQELDVVCEILPTKVDAGPESRGEEVVEEAHPIRHLCLPPITYIDLVQVFDFRTKRNP